MRLWKRSSLAVAFGALSWLGAMVVSPPTWRLQPEGPAWPRAVRGAPGGALRGDAVVTLPGLHRSEEGTLRIAVTSDVTSRIGVVFPGQPVRWAWVDRARPGYWTVPRTDTPGLRFRLRPPDDAQALLRITALEVAASPSPTGAALAGASTLLLTFVLLAGAAPLGWALGLWLTGLIIASTVPLLLLWTWPEASAVIRLGVPVLALLAPAAFALRHERRRAFFAAAAWLAALVFGAWVRLYFLPAPGGWDTDYWKAIAAHAAEHGYTQVYGGPDAIPQGHFWEQLHGREPRFEVQAFGRAFVVDQPPGIQMLWAGSWWLVRHALDLAFAEGQNVAAKLPSILGDCLAVLVLVGAFPNDRRRGLTLAALYWALPVSWLSGSVLGFFDGAQAPLAVAALVAAGRGRAAWAGGLLAAAALVKSTALIVLPAAAMALWVARAPIKRAVAVGLGVVGSALVPFIVQGTLATAVVHVYRILFQERLSGGFANLWWIGSHILSLGVDARTWADPIPFVRLEVLPWPAGPTGVALFAVVAVFVLRQQRRRPGPRAATLAGATLIFAYAMFAVGVHENHPMGLYLMLLATGLVSPTLRIVTAILFTTNILGMLGLSGLGRFYGLRYAGIEPLTASISDLRMSPGFDLTLLLAAVNLSVFVYWLFALSKQFECVGATDSLSQDAVRDNSLS